MRFLKFSVLIFIYFKMFFFFSLRKSSTWHKIKFKKISSYLLVFNWLSLIFGPFSLFLYFFFFWSLTFPVILQSHQALGRLAKTACTSGPVFQGAPEGTEIHFLSSCLCTSDALPRASVDLSQVSQCLTVSLPSIFP